jgi:hypothetical protein
VQLAFLEALQLKLVLDGALREAGYDVIEVSVLEVQLIDALPEHFTVNGMHHWQVPPYRLDGPSIDLKKIKNEARHGLAEAPFSRASEGASA